MISFDEPKIAESAVSKDEILNLVASMKKEMAESKKHFQNDMSIIQLMKVAQKETINHDTLFI